MPELPEVETTVRGVRPAVVDRRIEAVRIRERRLRWPVSRGLSRILGQKRVVTVSRRAKYILLNFSHGTLMIHLGMSGRLRVVPADTPYVKHDHVDLVFDSGKALRFHDPRRFGSVLWFEGPATAATRRPIPHSFRSFPRCDRPAPVSPCRALGLEAVDQHGGRDHLHPSPPGDQVRGLPLPWAVRVLELHHAPVEKHALKHHKHRDRVVQSEAIPLQAALQGQLHEPGQLLPQDLRTLGRDTFAGGVHSGAP